MNITPDSTPKSLSLEPATDPAPAATGLRTCPRCSYRRRAEDAAPLWQCPRCGVAYDKAALPVSTAQRAQQRAERLAQAQRSRPAPSRLPWLFVGVALTAAAGWGYTAWQHKSASQQAAAGVAARSAAIAAASSELQLAGDLELAEQHLRMARPAEGLALLERHAAEGHPAAMMALGVAYQGYGHAPKDAAKAEQWMRRAAQEGSLLAYVHLGLAHETGRGASYNIEEAANQYRFAARQGDAYGLYALGMLYGKGGKGGEGFPADPVAGLMLLELAHQAWTADPRSAPFAPRKSPHSAQYEANQLAKTLSPVDVARARDWAAAWKPGQPFPFR